MRNKDRWQGFAAGVLVSVLALGLGGAALAAGRTIEVQDGIAVTINGVPFTPRDANGREVPLFAYNGTTYAPVRAFSKAAGLSVDYDSETRTARIETADYTAQSDPNAGSYIGVEKARELALAHAGVKAENARVLKASLDWEDGRAVYEVEFCSARTEYDYEVDALTGDILSWDNDCEDFDWSCHDDYRIDRGLHLGWQNGHHAENHGHHGGRNVPTGLITAESAKAKALEKLPGAAVTKCELDEDDGVWKYELELTLDGVEYDCDVNASTGEILKWEKDD